jgi:hypothetical protein
MSDHGVPAGESFDREEAADITSLSEEELKERLGRLVEEERALSYRLRVLQGRIDLMRAELVSRGAVVGSTEELVRALMGDRRP